MSGQPAGRERGPGQGGLDRDPAPAGLDLTFGFPFCSFWFPWIGKLLFFSVTAACFWGKVDGKKQQLAIQVPLNTNPPLGTGGLSAPKNGFRAAFGARSNAGS